jgi:hypothetical protein
VTLRASRRLALVLGTVTPLAETYRRWDEIRALTVWWPAVVDDFLLGGFLLIGAWWVGHDPTRGRPILSAAWGFMCGIAYGSLTFQLANLTAPEPSGWPATLVVGIKAIGLIIGIVGLIGSLNRTGVAGSG